MKSPASVKPKIVTPEKWLAARLDLLRAEKEFTRLRDQLTQRRQEMPWVKMTKPYTFDAPQGKVTLADLFDGRSQLLVQHFMLGPGWEQGCKSCSFMMDHFNPTVVHLKARDVSFAAISQAPLKEILPFKKRMGWNVNWVSSHGTDFNRDFDVSFTEEEIARGGVDYNYSKMDFPQTEAPGISVFARDAKGTIYHTYSTYGRGVDVIMGTYHLLDLVPKGRDEEGMEYGMEWLRHHDRMPRPLTDRVRQSRRWLIPAALLALAPKCVLCGLAYAGFGTLLVSARPELCGGDTGAVGHWLWVFPALGATGLAVTSYLHRSSGS